ncbi:MAG TPA: hypothetical protein VF753_07685 [Terriglobales bacterium]
MRTLILALCALIATAQAVTRKPIDVISSLPGEASPVIAAQDGVLAIACRDCDAENQITLYALGTWNLIATLTLSDPNAQVLSIAIQNKYIIAGAVNPITGSNGSAYVFCKPSAGWSNEQETAVLNPSDPQQGSYFGISVAVWGSTVVVGSPGYGLNNTGKAYVYIEPASGWTDATENAQLTASDGAPYWQLGTSVAITGPVPGGGNLIALGTPQNGGMHTVKPGAVYVYEEPPSGWGTMTQNAKLTIAGRSGDLGNSVAIAKGVVVAGMPDNGAGGQLAIYDEPQSGWANTSQPSYLLFDDESVSLGYVVSLTENGSVLTACCGRTFEKDHPLDLSFLWHADQQWSKTIRLSAEGLTDSAGALTSTADWAFTADQQGHLFVFDGK